jgi:hypothetical protein
MALPQPWSGMLQYADHKTGSGSMTSPDHASNEMLDNDGQDNDAAPRRGRAWLLTGGVAVLLLAGTAVAAVTTRHPPAPAAPFTASPTATTTAAVVATIPPAMPEAQAALTRQELTALAARLPGPIRLTKPASWAQWAGTKPVYVHDIDGCPHIADQLATDLGGRWTYTFGTLPQGPAGCNWTPVPWIPEKPLAGRFFVTIGYETGSLPDLMNVTFYCASGAESLRIDVSAAGEGAVLYGCDDPNGPGYDLALPDPSGVGVWFFSSGGGTDLPASRAADGLLALVNAATRAYA